MTEYRHLSRHAWLLGGAAAALAVAAPTAARAPVVIRGGPAATVSVYATGFNDPRELKFGPDGLLYVAEGGTGGSNSTVGLCTQVPFPVGPTTGSPTGGRISKVVNGVRVTVTDQFPSATANPIIGGDIQGVADIAFIGNTLYALTAGGGCSHGVLNHPNGIYRVKANGSTTLIANLSAFLQSHPVKNPEPDDFEPDGTWYSMVAVRGSFLRDRAQSWRDRPDHDRRRNQPGCRYQRDARPHRSDRNCQPRRLLRRQFGKFPDHSRFVEDTPGHAQRTASHRRDGPDDRAGSRVRQSRAHVRPGEYGHRWFPDAR